jgi:cytochrome c oxidase subunit 2
MIDLTSIFVSLTSLTASISEATESAGVKGTFWMPPAESTAAAGTDFAFNLINWICYFFFAGIVIALIWLTVKYRQKGKEIVYQADAPNHSTPLEVTWTVIPVLLVVGIFFIGFKGYLDLVTPPRNAYEINVVAQQWGWSFKYPNGATSDHLRVPAGQPVKLVMRSQDVLHSLYIPNFRVKQDLVPGRYSYLWFQSDDVTGNVSDDEAATTTIGHHLLCTEYCGQDHSYMNRKVFVMEESDFEEWTEQQARWLDEVPDEELYYVAGPRIWARCKSCHSLNGFTGTGPSWGDYEGLGNVWARSKAGSTPIKGGSRATGETTLKGYIGPGKLYETPEDYLRASILNPGELYVAPYGPAMPRFKGQLGDRAVDALIGMMKHVDEFDSNGVYIGDSKGTDPIKGTDPMAAANAE